MAAIWARPISPAALVTHLVAEIVARPAETALRVAVDGAPAADPAALGDRLVDPLRAAGRAAIRISAENFQRPASLRLEYGRSDPNSFYEDWFDFAGLRREVLDPLGPGGSGQYLPALWDPLRDRSMRCPRVPTPPHAVVLVDGALLLGRGLAFDVTLHLHLSEAALLRRTAEAQRWTLPAYARYDREVQPTAAADLVIRLDDPRHPALVRAAGHDSN